MSIQVNPRSAKWVFTINNYTEEMIYKLDEWFNSGVCKYAVYGKEVAPTTGTQHLQGYMHLEKRQYRRTIATSVKINGNPIWSYLQPANGSELQNRDYCIKSGNFKEFGALTITDQKEVDKKQKVMNVMNDWMQLTKEEFEEKWPYEALHWRRKLMDWEASKAMKSDVWDGDLRQKNLWIWGPPGTGKSKWARSQAQGACYCKLINKWWGGYEKRFHKIVLMEDYPVDGKYLTQQMKLWSDRYVFIAETKGGQQLIDPGCFYFIVTSNHSMEEIFEGEDLNAIKRRFTEVEIATNQDIYLNNALDFSILKVS